MHKMVVVDFSAKVVTKLDLNIWLLPFFLFLNLLTFILLILLRHFLWNHELILTIEYSFFLSIKEALVDKFRVDECWLPFYE